MKQERRRGRSRRSRHEAPRQSVLAALKKNGKPAQVGAPSLGSPCGLLAPDAGFAPSVHPFPPAEAGRRPFSCKQGGRPRLGHEWRATFPLGGHEGSVAGHLRPSQGPRGPHASALSPVRPCPQERLSPPSRTDRCGGLGRIRRRPVRVCAAGGPSDLRGAPCLPPHQMWRGPPGRSARPCGLGTGSPRRATRSPPTDLRRSAALWGCVRAAGVRSLCGVARRWADRGPLHPSGPCAWRPSAWGRPEPSRGKPRGRSGVRFRIPRPMTVCPACAGIS